MTDVRSVSVDPMQRAPAATGLRQQVILTSASPLRIVVLLWSVAAVVAAVGFGALTVAQVTLLVVPLVAAWLVRRRSLLVSLSLAVTALYFGAPAIILGQDRSLTLVVLVVLWTAGLTLGTLFVRGGVRKRASNDWPMPRWPQLFLTAPLIGLQLYLSLSGNAGYVSQLSGGLTAAPGISGILAAAAPLIVTMFIISALSARRWVRTAIVLGLVETFALSFSGFRGAGPWFIIGVIIAAALTLPQASAWRRPRRIVAVFAILAILSGGAFVVASNLRNQAAANLGYSSSTTLFELDKEVPILASRLDLGPPLNYAIQFQDNVVLKQDLSWVSQLQAFIPRFLFPDKPVVDYGRTVAAVVYGDDTGLTSNSLGSIGDMVLNFGIPGVIVVSVFLGFLLSLAERRIAAGGVLALVLAAGMAHAVQAWEVGPVILTIVGLTRNVLVVWVLWRVSQLHLTKQPLLSPRRPLAGASRSTRVRKAASGKGGALPTE